MSDQTIRPGFAWACEIDFSGEDFPDTASFRAQFRTSLQGSVLLDITREISRQSATVLRISLGPEHTGRLPAGAVFFDVVRTDADPPAHLAAEFEVMVRQPFTRLV